MATLQHYANGKKRLDAAHFERMLGIERKAFCKRDVLDLQLEVHKQTNFLLLAVDGDALVGYLIYTNNTVPKVLKLAVDGKFRRRGIGRQLMQFVLQRFSVVELHVAHSRTEAFALYSSLDFKVIESVPNYYGDRAAFLMRWTKKALDE